MTDSPARCSISRKRPSSVRSSASNSATERSPPMDDGPRVVFTDRRGMYTDWSDIDGPPRLHVVPPATDAPGQPETPSQLPDATSEPFEAPDPPVANRSESSRLTQEQHRDV